MAHVLLSCALAAAATWSGSNPNFLWSSLSGAEAPKVFIPITWPEVPTYRLERRHFSQAAQVALGLAELGPQKRLGEVPGTKSG